MTSKEHQAVLRSRDHHAAVPFEELFFDLVYVFAVTQLSHHLLEHLTLLGALQTLVLWFAVWLGWQYTAWVTNWFDPETRPIRTLLFAVMGVALVSASALPEAFGERGLVFAAAYALMQIGRTVVVLYLLGASSPLFANFRRILVWLVVSGALWIAGGLAEPQMRLALWALAVACEYFSPMAGFPVPGLGRSRTTDWTIDGGHLIERCGLFVIVALGETIVVMGATLAHGEHWETPTLIAFAVSFVGAIALWWIYFDTSSKDGARVIKQAADPGRTGAYFHYIHVILIAGIIVSAVANDLVIAHPHGHMETKYLAALIGGPAIYLIGNALYKHVVYGRWPISHGVGLIVLAAIVPFAYSTDLLVVGALTTLAVLVVAGWDALARR